MASLLLGLCALACPISMVAMMVMMRRRRGDGSSVSERGDPSGGESRLLATAPVEEERDGSQA